MNPRPPGCEPGIHTAELPARHPIIVQGIFLSFCARETKPRKIVLVSPPSCESFERAMLLGVDSCLVKPVDGEALLYVVRELLGEARARNPPA